MPKYMVVRSRFGYCEATFYDDKKSAEEFFTDMWTGYNDWEQVQLYHFCCGRYSLLRDVVKGDCL